MSIQHDEMHIILNNSQKKKIDTPFSATKPELMLITKEKNLVNLCSLRF